MTTTTTPRRGRTDLAHHHPRVGRNPLGGWTWECDCGGASARSQTVRLTWHQAFVGALIHSASISP
ncbi:MAG TPA: hypothetical protein VFN43_01105 [Humibacillus sp.]|nr:hypothetical protein [Humibacillus sp.]